MAWLGLVTCCLGPTEKLEPRCAVPAVPGRAGMRACLVVSASRSRPRWAETAETVVVLGLASQ